MQARCAVCLHTMPLRGEGAIHVHGPVGQRCVGSGKPPSSVGLNIAAACHSLLHGPAPALRSKHPAAHPDTSLPSAPKEEALEAALVVSEREVSQAIRSFPRGSAGGPDGLRPQHLVDMTSMSAGGGGKGGSYCCVRSTPSPTSCSSVSPCGDTSTSLWGLAYSPQEERCWCAAYHSRLHPTLVAG